MTLQRIIIEMGTGNDLHGGDYQKAAKRAIENALRRSTLPIFDSLGLDHSIMKVRVTIGVQDPSQIDCDALAAALPRGKATVTAQFGGQNVTNPENGETAIVATAAVEAFLPSQTGKWQRTDT